DVLIAQRKTLIGPLNFNTFHSYRLRMEGVPSWGMFDREPVNPLYYPNLLLKLGFTIKGFFESRHVENKHVNDFYAHKKPFLERIANLPFEFVALTSETWSRYENSIYEFVDETFGANPAYKVISKTEFSLLYNEEFADKLCPYSSVLFVDKANGKIAALSFCQPNYASLNAKSPEPIFSRDFEKLERKILLIKTIGVHPNYRNQNLMSYLGAYAMLSFTKLYDEAIFCLMRSDNVSTNFTRGLPYDTAKYALFEKGS
ncbi:MAG: hypothetical protein JWQ25_3055, partial [Daejeonella sp.]|nr:hypothetical protein [Daejeonella sp.]